MEPDRSNYEIWLIDWIEGRLSDQEADLLRSFLDKNPDLKKEAESLSLPELSPSPGHFSGKNSLKRSPSDLDRSQIEYLSVAWLENDLTDEQAEELKESLDHNPENKVLFDSMQRIKLSPSGSHYKYKSRLKKMSATGNVMRFLMVGLATAASVALLISSILFIPRFFRDTSISNINNIVPDTHNIQPFIVSSAIIKKPSELSDKASPEINKRSASTRNIIPSSAENVQINQPGEDSLTSEEKFLITRITYIPEINDIALNVISSHSSLIASAITIEEINNDEERSRLGKFIARTLRQRVLKDQVTDDTPLKGYEIAEVGIEGLNRLFGWDMSLVRTNDDNGDLKSYYFSSKVLKFNAPVKKAIPAP